MKTAYIFSMTQYVDKALQKAEYYRDENGVVIAKVPDAPGFFAQGDNFEEARNNLREVIEGNVILALQLGLPIPEIEGVKFIKQTNAQTHTT
ncbi:type II toxin-antitoxin system HicB family antitoxin [Candidatus Sumerlaeota bacterium]|nr:type II toxin-antitoxin system HicB family antitoxin [Candidatus Sumerlaeota bacterium]